MHLRLQPRRAFIRELHLERGFEPDRFVLVAVLQRKLLHVRGERPHLGHLRRLAELYHDLLREQAGRHPKAPVVLVEGVVRRVPLVGAGRHHHRRARAGARHVRHVAKRGPSAGQCARLARIQISEKSRKVLVHKTLSEVQGERRGRSNGGFVY